MSSVPIAIRAAGLTKRYGSRTVLDEVSFDVSEGAFVAVLGRSGAGKTTLVRCLAGLAEPSQGTVSIAGTDPRRMRDGSIGVVFQAHNLVRRATALENVLVGTLGRTPPWRTLTRSFAPQERTRGLEALERVGLGALADVPADKLSGGERQRVAIARVFAQRSRFVFADEPIASLDPVAAHDVLSALRALALEQRVTVVCSLHQVEFAMAYAERIIGISEGRIVTDGARGAFGDLERSYVYA